MSEQSFSEAEHRSHGYVRRARASTPDEEAACAVDVNFTCGQTPVAPRRHHEDAMKSTLFVGARVANEGVAKTYCFKIIKTPVGALKLIASRDRLAAVLWENDNPNRVRLKATTEDNRHPALLDAERQLKEYFDGQRRSFDLRLDFAGTAFQSRVWNALLEIPFGETRSYADIARHIGAPGAVRAVGAANGKNPISIVAPCHRVIGANGKLTGFAGGLEIKSFLLNLEKLAACNLERSGVAGSPSAW